MINSHAIYIEKLNPEFKSSFKIISDYVYSNNMDEIRNEEILSEVMDTFLEAQNNGKSVDQVTGDLKSFCRQICSDIGFRSRLINFLELLQPLFIVYSILCVMDVIDLIMKISDGETVDFLVYKGNDNIIAYLIGCLIVIVSGYIGKAVMKRYIFEYPGKYKKITFGVRAITVAFVFAAFVLVFKDSEIEGTYLWLSIICCAVFWTVYRILTSDSRKYRKENRISFSELAGSSPSVLNDIEKIEMNRMEKLNAKKARKGESEMTLEEFCEYEKKQMDKWYNRPFFYTMIAVLSTVAGLVFTLLNGGFESAFDIVFFIMILLTCEGLIMFGLYKASRIGFNERYRWIESKLNEQ